MTETDNELIDWLISFEENDTLNAEKYGDFSLARMDISVYLSDKELELFHEAEKILLENNGNSPSEKITQDYYRFIQAHNHELFHYYQALALPAFQIYQRLSKGKLEHEADVLFRFIEEGNYYTIGKQNSILKALKQENFQTSEDVMENLNEILSKYRFYAKQWYSELYGLSLHHIIEGMAHIFSIQLTDSNENYLSLLEDNSDYYVAYNIFDSFIDEELRFIDARTKNLTFLYFCYFSCQTYDHIEDTLTERPSRIFYMLCSQVNQYFITFLELTSKYNQYSKDQLQHLNPFDILEDFQSVSKAQVVNTYAFFELIPSIQKEAEKYYRDIPQDKLNNPNEFLYILKNLNIDLKQHTQLAHFATFPTVWANMWEMYDRAQETKIDNNDFKISDESTYYEFIINCKNLLSYRKKPIFCCEEHGLTADKIKVLKCKNKGSFAYYFKGQTGIEPTNIFKISGV